MYQIKLKSDSWNWLNLSSTASFSWSQNLEGHSDKKVRKKGSEFSLKQLHTVVTRHRNNQMQWRRFKTASSRHTINLWGGLMDVSSLQTERNQLQLVCFMCMNLLCTPAWRRSMYCSKHLNGFGLILDIVLESAYISKLEVGVDHLFSRTYFAI